MKSFLEIGDHVLFHSNDGKTRESVITNIEITAEPGEMYGLPVKEIDWSRRSCVVVDLDDGKWAFGTQIEPVE